MKMSVLTVSVAAFFARSVSAGRVGLRSSLKVDGYTFAQFTKDFQKSYTAGSEEYRQRAALFEAARARIQARNSKNTAEGRSWTAGVSPFMDANPQERRALAGGYKPGRRAPTGSTGMTGLQTGGSGRSTRSRSNETRILDSFSWNDQGVGPCVRNQGNCGSCWAVSAIEAVEAQLQKNGAGSVKLSAQALLDCVPNPQHCGGTGGCDGATGELAYSFMRDVGLPLESDHQYMAKTGSCPMDSNAVSTHQAYPTQARVRLSGWDQLPSNKAEPVMRALVEEGPVVVAVDANDWFDYERGVFDGCNKDAELGHSVLLKGYGEDGGKKYWQIQNSWGVDWGEQGFIRITRHEDDDMNCGVDSKPQDGVGCDGGPSEVKVCGACGLLFDPVVPQGARIEGAQALSQPPNGMPDGQSPSAHMEALMGYSRYLN